MALLHAEPVFHVKRPLLPSARRIDAGRNPAHIEGPKTLHVKHRPRRRI